MQLTAGQLIHRAAAQLRPAAGAWRDRPGGNAPRRPFPPRRRALRPAAAVFRFRHFDLHQGGAAHKMGTDAMLLGAWTHPGSAATVLDVGTGTGVLAIMAAQRTRDAARVDAIDIDAGAVSIALVNTRACAWAPKLSVHQASLQAWAGLESAGGPSPPQGRRYDLIISNPPFFLSSSKPDMAGRAAARHADLTLPFEDLAAGAAALLAPDGRLSVILPTLEAQYFAAIAAHHGLHLRKLLRVFTRGQDAHPKRHLMQFALGCDSAAPRVAGASSMVASAAVAGQQPPASWADMQRQAAPAAAAGQVPAADVADLVLNERRHDQALGREVTVFTPAYKELTAEFHDPAFLL